MDIARSDIALMKNTGIVIEYLEDYICPVQRFSTIKISSFDYSVRNKRCILEVLGFVLEIFLEKTDLNC